VLVDALDQIVFGFDVGIIQIDAYVFLRFLLQFFDLFLPHFLEALRAIAVENGADLGILRIGPQ